MANAAGLSGTSKGPGHVESENSYSLRCPEHHDRVAELFCRRCRRCVCTLCPVLGAHRGHPVGLALEEAVHVQVGTRGAHSGERAREQRLGWGVPGVQLPVRVSTGNPKAAGSHPDGRPIFQNEKLRPKEGPR